MALNIKNAEVEKLAAEVAELAHESKTQAIRKALEERKLKLKARTPEQKKRDLERVLERQIWPFIRPERLGKSISKEEIEDILGIGPHGY